MSQSLTVSSEGLEIPEEYMSADKFSVKTPEKTIEVQKNFVIDGVFSLVTPNDFEVSEDEANNPELLPNTVRLKVYGEEAELFEVEFSEG